MSQPLNVLFILSEHHNPFFLGHTNPITQTPSLDRLAEKGTRFDYTYCASPHCVPARGALWSGRYSHETGIWCNSFPWSADVPGWSHYLRDQGVHVTTIGKLDFMPGRDHGMTEEIIPRHRDSLDIHSLYREQPIQPRYKDIVQIRAPRPRDDYPDPSADDATMTEALRWIKEGRPGDKPWLLNVNLLKVHPPWAPPRAMWEKYESLVKLEDLPPKYSEGPECLHPYFRDFSRHACDEYVTDEDKRKAHIGFHALTEMLDTDVGRLLSALETEGLADSTVVVYSTDHGASVHAHRCWTLINPWEDSARVPLIIRHPDGMPGIIDKTPTHHHDIFPTIAEVMGLEPPADLRGVSLMGAVGDGDTASRRPFTLCEIHNNGWARGIFAVSDGHWKYIECVGARPLLFDLHEDPGEVNDLVISRPDDAEVIQAIGRARAWLCSICSPALVDDRARADQRKLRAELEATGQLEREVVKRGWQPNTEELIPDSDLLEELGIEPAGDGE